jgi:hypothetical protein
MWTSSFRGLRLELADTFCVRLHLQNQSFIKWYALRSCIWGHQRAASNLHIEGYGRCQWHVHRDFGRCILRGHVPHDAINLVM